MSKHQNLHDNLLTKGITCFISLVGCFLAVVFPTLLLKIRSIICICCIAVLYSFLGFTRSAFADWPGECVFVLGVDSAYQQVDTINRYSCEILINTNNGDIYSGNCRIIPKNSEPLWWGAYLYTYYYENGKWNIADTFQGGAYLTYPIDGTELPDGCSTIPSREKPAKENNMGPPLCLLQR